jgi:hypothetical protein
MDTHSLSRISAVLNELLYGNEVMESVEQTLDCLVTPDFTQRINGAGVPPIGVRRTRARNAPSGHRWWGDAGV